MSKKYQTINIAGSKDINFIIEKLEELEERLGGRKKGSAKSSITRDEFGSAKLIILETINTTKAKLIDFKRKKEGNFRRVDVSRVRLEVSDNLRSLNLQLNQLDNIVKSHKKDKKMADVDKEKKRKVAK